MNRSPESEGVMESVAYSNGVQPSSYSRTRGSGPNGGGVGGGNAGRKSNLAASSAYNDDGAKKGRVSQQQQQQQQHQQLQQQQQAYARDNDIHGFDISQRSLGLGSSLHGVNSLLGSGSAHGISRRQNMMQGGYGMRGVGSQSDFGALSPHGSGPSMLGGNYMNDIAISPNHLGHRMSIGFPNLAGTASPGLGGGMDTSLRSTGPPMSAEEQAQAEREEELLLNLLIARRQRGRNAGPDGNPANQPSLSDELVRLKQSQGMGDVSLRGDLGMSSHGGSMRMNRGLGSGPSSRIPGMPPLFDGPVDSFQGGGYPMADYPHMSRQSNSLMQQNHARMHSHHVPNGYQQHPQLYGQMSGGSKSHYHPGMSHSQSGSRMPPVQPMQSQQFGHSHMQMQDDMSERIIRTPQRLLMDARSANQQSMAEFSDRGIKRPLPGSYVGGPGTYESANLNYQANLEMQGVEIPKPKPKRQHKKKPADMPRRPLSAYNLFFSEERERILKEIEGKDGDDKDGDKKDNDGGSDGEPGDASKDDDDSKKDDSKPKALMRPLIPAQKKRRPHRKTHGKISFQQLARMVGERWKSLPDDQRKYYQDLAQEDMKRQKIAMEEYYAKQNAAKLKQNSGSSPKPDDDKNPITNETDTNTNETGSPLKKPKTTPPAGVEKSDALKNVLQRPIVGEQPV